MRPPVRSSRGLEDNIKIYLKNDMKVVVVKLIQHYDIVNKDVLPSVHTYVAILVAEPTAMGTIIKNMMGTTLPVLNH